MQNKFRFALAAGLLGSLAIAGTVFAQTTPPPQGGRPGFGSGHMGMAHSGVFGTVTAISGDTLTVTSKGFLGRGTPPPGAPVPSVTPTPAAPVTYTVNAANATVTKNGVASTVSAIAVGDTIMVQGTVSGTSVTATAIRDGVVPGARAPGSPKPTGSTGTRPTPVIQGNGEPIIAGSITAISGDTLTVTNKSNVTYAVDATNATISIKNAKSMLSSVAVGDSVVVQGTVNGTAVTASSVIDQGAPKTTPPVSPSGSPSSSGSGSTHGGFFSSVAGFFKRLFGF